MTMRVWLIALLSSWIMLIQDTALARTLEFESIDETSLLELKKEFPILWREDWSFADLAHATQFLMLTKRFDQVTVHQRKDSNDHFVLRALSTRFVNAVEIIGNNALSKSEIIETLGIKTSERFDRKALVNGAEKLKDRYGQMGYLNSTIEISFESPEPQKLIVKINVQENEPCRMFEITIDTPNKALQEALARRIIRYKGQPLTEERVTQINDRFTTYFRENRYISARVAEPVVDYNESKTQARIKLKIENPYRIDLILEGNKRLTTPTILRALDIESFIATSNNPSTEIAARITEIYKERGYANVLVNHYEKPIARKQFLRQEFFQIKEGHRIRIDNVSIGGSFSQDPEYYENFILNNSTDLISSGYYNRQGIELGTQNLQVELQNRGYLKAKVLSIRTDFDESKKRANIVINLDEGPLTKIRSIQLTGIEKFKESELLEELGLKNNSPLSLSELEKGLERLKVLYQNHGYLEMTITNEKQDLVKYSDDNSEAELTIGVYEGPQVQIGTIIIEGNNKTKDYVLLKELQFKEDDILTSEMINEGITRLLRMGIFSNVNIRTLEAGTNIAKRTVVVTVDESNPGLFNAGIGVNDEARFTIRSYVGAGYNNINGTARAVTGRADVDYATDPRLQFPNNTLTLGYYEPFLLGTRNRARVSVVRSQRWFEIGFDSQDRPTLTIQESMDGKIFIERSLSLNVKFIWLLYGYEVLRLYETHGFEPDNDTANIASVGPTFEVDFRNNILNPTTGSFSRWTTEYARPELGGSDKNGYFVRSDAQFSHYIPLTDSHRWVWANQVRGGYLQNLSDIEGSGVPGVRAFLLGGRTTVRGFEPAYERFPTLDALNIERAKSFRYADFRVRNNSSYYLLKTELRFPIWKSLGGVIFYDGGAVYVSGYRFDDPYRDAVGFGLRYLTPVGPVSVEMGYKLDRRYLTAERPSRTTIHFSIGTF